MDNSHDLLGIEAVVADERNDVTSDEDIKELEANIGQGDRGDFGNDETDDIVDGDGYRVSLGAYYHGAHLGRDKPRQHAVAAQGVEMVSYLFERRG